MFASPQYAGGKDRPAVVQDGQDVRFTCLAPCGTRCQYPCTRGRGLNRKRQLIDSKTERGRERGDNFAKPDTVKLTNKDCTIIIKHFGHAYGNRLGQAARLAGLGLAAQLGPPICVVS